MLNINPTKIKIWSEIKNHFNNIKNVSLLDLFKNDKKRFINFSLLFNNKILVDFSKNNINKNTLILFFKLLEEMNLKNFIKLMLLGEKINFTENRSVLHIYLRDIKKKLINDIIDKKNIYSFVNKNLLKIKKISNYIIKGKWLSFCGKKIKNIVNIGIGGSDLGPKMVNKALSDFKNHIKLYYISNIDTNDIFNILKKLSPKDTLFIICSKTFTTIETILNAKIAKKWILNFYKNDKKSINYHFIGISNNIKKVINFGINKNNIFFIPDWVGGRYSLFSSVGLSISLSIGFSNFLKLLEGANDMDIHFLNSEYYCNIPIILAIIGIWYNNFFKYDTESILIYNEYLSYFPLFLQQLIMESNGKNIDRNNKFITEYKTSPVIFGGTGTNSQHSFFQFLYQGTKIIPCDFIASIKHNKNNSKYYLRLISNFFAQTKALAFGNSNNLYLEKFKIIKGNRPSTTILLNEINPYNLGSLISIYENKVLVQGFILNISSFDQWGVELGKNISKDIYLYLNNKNKFYNDKNKIDNSTFNLIKFFNKNYIY